MRGTLDAATLGRARAADRRALAGGVRWLIVDARRGAVAWRTQALAALVTAARELRSRKGELIVAGAAARRRRSGSRAYEVAHRPAQAASVDQAIMILKMLRPKTDIEHPGSRARSSASRR